MDATQFDRLVISLGATTARRGALRLLAGFGPALLALHGADEVGAHNLLAKCKKIKDKKKRKKCLKKARAHHAQHAGQEPRGCETPAICPDPPAGQLCAQKTCVDGQCGIGPRPDGVTCRPSAGTCDRRESCDGISLQCPPDEFYPSSVGCRVIAHCADSHTLQLPAQCPGDGPDCPPLPAPIDCSPFGCWGEECRTQCFSDAYCAGNHYCSIPNCLTKQANGQACAEARQCQSGHCVDGVCCNSVCKAPANTTRTCTGGTCAFACLEGFGDCDGSMGNGCETDITANKQHCGGCDQLCAGPCPPGQARLCEDRACVCN